jgi:2-desacetyl-2-hydroxyethyl bacteriochlorophyllide A dehydrogenase
MKALRLAEPRRFEWLDIPEPSPPQAGTALVAVRAIGICGTDISGYLGKMPFIQFPRILGHELGVEVLAVGAGVTNVAVGDCCSVEPYMNCGTCHACLQGKTNCCETLTVLGVHGDGGMCERLLLPAHKLHRGGNLSFEQLALVETLAIGCHAVNRATISKNDSVLIIGAGPIGLSVLEFARLETDNVSILELNSARRAFVERHYPNVKVLAASPAENSAQIIFDATGSPASMSSATKYARFTGRIIFVGITKEPVTLDDPLFHRRELTLLASRNAIASDFTRIIDLIQRNVIDTQPWISHRAHFNALPETFPDWLLPESGVIKAVVML